MLRWTTLNPARRAVTERVILFNARLRILFKVTVPVQGRSPDSRQTLGATWTHHVQRQG
jgi:hypothetical protein